MNVKEHLLTVLAEECAEVQLAISKTLRFGKDDCRPGSTVTNAKEIEKEFIEAMCVRDMLRELGVIVQPDEARRIYEEKRKRVAHYIEYAKSRGTISS